MGVVGNEAHLTSGVVGVFFVCFLEIQRQKFSLFLISHQDAIAKFHLFSLHRR